MLPKAEWRISHQTSKFIITYQNNDTKSIPTNRNFYSIQALSNGLWYHDSLPWRRNYELSGFSRWITRTKSTVSAKLTALKDELKSVHVDAQMLIL